MILEKDQQDDPPINRIAFLVRSLNSF